jgi:hypothetical protein
VEDATVAVEQFALTIRRYPSDSDEETITVQ